MSKAAKKKRTEYLSYIEETEKHTPKLIQVARKATRNAVKESRSLGVPITYLEGNSVIREESGGTKKVIEIIADEQIILNKGERVYLSQE